MKFSHTRNLTRSSSFPQNCEAPACSHSPVLLYYSVHAHARPPSLPPPSVVSFPSFTYRISNQSSQLSLCRVKVQRRTQGFLPSFQGLSFQLA